MDRNSGYERCFWISLTLFLLVVVPPRTSFAINVVVDYRYDSQNFFNSGRPLLEVSYPGRAQGEHAFVYCFTLNLSGGCAVEDELL